MHIDSIQLFRVPLRGLKATAEQGGALESVVAAMHSGGTVGLGEVTLAAGPFDCAEWSEGTFVCLRDWLAPALVGRSIHSGEELQKSLAHFQGNARAKAALDTAWWNLSSLQQGKPLYQLLGGRNRAIPVSASLGVMDSTDALFVEIAKALKTSEVVTLKFRPGWSVEMLRAVRQAFPTEPLAIDCDALCSLGQQEMFYRLEDFHLSYIEQPLAADDLVGHAMLQQSLKTPICLDQSVTSLERVEQAIDLGSCRQIRINPGRVGGLTPALAIRTACEAAKIPCAVGGAPQGKLQAYTVAALATLPNFSGHSEIFSGDREAWALKEDFRLEEKQFEKSGFLLPEISGPGIAIDLALLAEASVEQATVC